MFVLNAEIDLKLVRLRKMLLPRNYYGQISKVATRHDMLLCTETWGWVCIALYDSQKYIVTHCRCQVEEVFFSCSHSSKNTSSSFSKADFKPLASSSTSAASLAGPANLIFALSSISSLVLSRPLNPLRT